MKRSDRPKRRTTTNLTPKEEAALFEYGAKLVKRAERTHYVLAEIASQSYLPTPPGDYDKLATHAADVDTDLVDFDEGRATLSQTRASLKRLRKKIVKYEQWIHSTAQQVVSAWRPFARKPARMPTGPAFLRDQ